jgi:hypothetical protein
MYRRHDEHGYRVLHRPWVGDDCVLRENVYDPGAPAVEKGQTHRTVALAVLGSLTRDKKGCTDPTGYVHPIGAQYYREHGHLWVCDAPRIEEQRDRCFLALAELPQKMQNQTTPIGRIARALDHGMARKAQAIDQIPGQVVNTADGVADGRITAGTVLGTLVAKAVDIAEHASLDAGKRWLKSKVDGVRELARKPAIEQGEILAEEAGDAMIPHPVTVGVAALTGGLGRGALSSTNKLEELAQVGKKVVKETEKEAIHAGGTASQVLLRTPQQLQAKFKHAPDFGVTGNYSKAKAAEFSQAIHRHVNSPGVRSIQGTYHRQPVTHFLDPSSGLDVLVDSAGNFISGWRLSPAQLQNVLSHGGL